MLNLLKPTEMKKLLFITLPLILLSCGQQSDKPFSEDQKNKITGEIIPLVTQLWESNEKLNYEKWLELYWDSKDFVFVNNGQILTYNEVAGFKEIWKLLEYQKYLPKNERFDVINRNAVLYTMQGSASVKYKSGDIFNTDKYAITCLFKKIDGMWKIVNGHASFQNPVPASQENTQVQK